MASISSKLLGMLRLRRCSHHFSWPRRWPDGEYYQVCLLCGAEYKYDWKAMCRTERVVGHKPQPSSSDSHPARDGRTEAHWVPRARRIKLHQQELQFRPKGVAGWQHGTIDNISSTGVLFHSEHVLADNTDIEMILEMPTEICGQKHAKVLCRGMVVRSIEAAEPGALPAMAAGIWDYKFLDQKTQ
jgi:hypothetical protein